MTIPTKQNSPTYRLFVLIVMVAIAGFAQGMLLPLLAIMLEKAGVSSSLNGLNAAALYIGILLASPFIEKPLRRYGYKPIITIGLMAMIVSLLVLPLWQAFWFWFVLRMIIGIADNMVHFATQVWITTTSPMKKRGRNISFYGFAFGLGFGLGPFMTRLLQINEFLPFILSAITSFAAWLLILRLRNEYPAQDVETGSQSGTWTRYKAVVKLGWFALLPAFCYGYLESSLHGNFPVYGLRSGLTVEQVSILLPAFVVGGLITQMPLGFLSDRMGRKPLLLMVLFFGGATFMSMVYLEHTFIGLFLSFALAGAFVGSLYSLGVMYMADLLPPHLLPTGNVMMAVSFGLGSMIGPMVGGVFIDLFERGSLYYSVSGILLLIFFLGICFRSHAPMKNQQKEVAHS
ncbi:MFS transporter [Halalkalibacterium halodurans]|jgi:MFS family permease|uniref:BH0884 protein n=2 Tax=Halalkalibacterium halodurans TaxID=86665 RepID=Q9KEG8_HALH5|nr:MFS transporter [Halalkalibacterium halodurans]MED4080753.1 MFS transporter [Halalkalibacterium halodurans]MED4086210.1 MFS transporter [Halalkalibacterium halodurans]MED4106892.1 MFS transporter [Halalkalibacterium halodurans]MED4110297.1 MFS transporter [Halalkalibacterium halodurans]MED4122860.1 MFS transporter [Halalkalibacterium halodurans]